MAIKVDLDAYQKLTIPVENEIEKIVGKKYEFPKYSTQIINLANQNAGGTRPRVVGQMSELVKECPVKTFSEWKTWYKSKFPRAIDDATGKIIAMLKNMQPVYEKIDLEMVKAWVEDLVLVKTFEGFLHQEIALKAVANRMKKSWRLATPQEESQNIDAYIGDIPVQIKPITYLYMNPITREEIKINIIFFEIKGKNLVVYTDLI